MLTSRVSRASYLRCVRIAFLMAAGLLLYPATGRCAILSNGSFEDTTNFVSSGSDTMILESGATAMTGWTTVNGELGWIGPTNPYGLSASNGSYFLDLTGNKDGSAPFGGVQQSITTVVGGQYVLSFDLGSDRAYNTGGTAGITATAGSTTQVFNFSTSNSNAWKPETMAFTATTTSTQITLTGSTGVAYIGLDHVSVVAVPEPSAFILCGLGAIGLLVAARRRRKA